ncbi:hypothetical protein JCM1840_007573 [Sporobolomyces johnsonii]
MSSLRQYRVASVQLPIVFYDAQENLVTILEAIKEAAANGAALVVFPECGLSGYPYHMFAVPYAEHLSYVQDFYTKGAVEADGPEAQALAACCKANKIRAVVGFSERAGGSLFMGQWIISPEGEIIVRRKFKPTSLERIVYGEGDGSDIKVHDTEIGRLGVLQCWENIQPLLKYAMASQHEEIHAAGWPIFPAEVPHYSLSRAGTIALLTSYAIETGTFVVSSSSFFTEQNIKKMFGEKTPKFSRGGGLTIIFGPGGDILAEAPSDERSIIYADVDLDVCYREKSILDPLGHYSRPDVFQVHFDTTPRHVVRVGAHIPAQPSGGYRQRRKQLYGEDGGVQTTPGSGYAPTEKKDEESGVLVGNE